MDVFQLVCETQDRRVTRGRPGQANNLAPSQTDFFKLFALGQGWRTLLRAHAHIADNLFGEILLRMEKTCVYEHRISDYSRDIDPYMLAPRATARLAQPLERPWSDVRILCADYHIAVYALSVQIYVYS